mmetsp:Transcript_8912/g.23143  ORF Transcript_8912/g.23143 Transcript_8912/m.23143 type:complete len:272 (+) Transcript_8912:385-1200(+)
MVIDAARDAQAPGEAVFTLADAREVRRHTGAQRAQSKKFGCEEAIHRIFLLRLIDEAKFPVRPGCNAGPDGSHTAAARRKQRGGLELPPCIGVACKPALKRGLSAIQSAGERLLDERERKVCLCRGTATLRRNCFVERSTRCRGCGGCMRQGGQHLGEERIAERLPVGVLQRSLLATPELLYHGSDLLEERALCSVASIGRTLTARSKRLVGQPAPSIREGGLERCALLSPRGLPMVKVRHQFVVALPPIDAVGGRGFLLLPNQSSWRVST